MTTPRLPCARPGCGHPPDWHRLDDAQGVGPGDPAARFRCIGYDCTADGPPRGDCVCPDYVRPARPAVCTRCGHRHYGQRCASHRWDDCCPYDADAGCTGRPGTSAPFCMAGIAADRLLDDLPVCACGHIAPVPPQLRDAVVQQILRVFDLPAEAMAGSRWWEQTEQGWTCPCCAVPAPVVDVPEPVTVLDSVADPEPFTAGVWARHFCGKAERHTPHIGCNGFGLFADPVAGCDRVKAHKPHRGCDGLGAE